MKIDFSKIVIKDIEDNETEVDISKDLGNFMYNEARDIAVADLGRDIYHKKEVDLTKEQAETVKLYVNGCFKAMVKRTLIPILESIE